MDEFEVVERFLAPLAAGEAGAFGLTDDAAVIDVRPGYSLVVTKDLLAAGVHFPQDMTPADLAVRSLAVNLSDLAAMGARPRAYLLGCALPPALGEAWWGAFCGQLARENERYGITLIGGDQIVCPGSLIISVTMLGEARRVLRRHGARPGDAVFVSGTIGDSAAGLALLKGELEVSCGGEYLLNRYRRPEPRVELGQALIGVATAALDISDGLAADLGHLCKQSGVGARVELEQIPLSPVLLDLVNTGRYPWSDVVSGGDDYELCCTAPSDMRIAGLTRIGKVVEGSDVIFLDRGGQALELERTGYRHG